MLHPPGPKNERGMNVTEEIQKYFFEQYQKASFRVVPGHWPNFKTKEDVDKWIKQMEKLINELFD